MTYFMNQNDFDNGQLEKSNQNLTCSAELRARPTFSSHTIKAPFPPIQMNSTGRQAGRQWQTSHCYLARPPSLSFSLSPSLNSGFPTRPLARARPFGSRVTVGTFAGTGSGSGSESGTDE